MAMVAPAQPDRCHALLGQRLADQLGAPVQVVSVQEEGDQLLRGVAVCGGRIMSFVLEAEQQRLRTRPLFQLIARSRKS
jgi:hypothetical protein